MRKPLLRVRTPILLTPHIDKRRYLTRQLLSIINPYCILFIEIYRQDSKSTCFLASLLESQRVFNEFVGILSTFLQILFVILEKIALFFSAISSVAALIPFYNERITVLFIKCVHYKFFSIKNSFYLFSCSYFYVNHIYRWLYLFPIIQIGLKIRHQEVLTSQITQNFLYTLLFEAQFLQTEHVLYMLSL